MAAGPAVAEQKSSYSRYGPNHYWLFKVGNFELKLLDEYAAVLRNGAVYRIYYVKVGKVPSILSLEETG